MIKKTFVFTMVFAIPLPEIFVQEKKAIRNTASSKTSGDGVVIFKINRKPYKLICKST